MTHVVYGIDNKYLPPLLVSIYTVLKFASNPVKITVFTVGNIDTSKIYKLVNHFPDTVLSVQNFDSELLSEYEKSSVAQRYPKASMIPLLIPWLIDSRCIFLDADTLILDDVIELFSLDLKGAHIGATQYFYYYKFFRSRFNWKRFIDHKRFENRRHKLIERAKMLGFTTEEFLGKYFSSGVLIFDSNIIRKSVATGEQLMNKLIESKRWTSLPDMDLLNYYFRDRVCYLDPKWNVFKDVYGHRKYLPQELADRLVNATKNPSILHYRNIYGYDCWQRPWYKSRRRYRVYKQICVEIEREIGLNIVQMFNSEKGSK